MEPVAINDARSDRPIRRGALGVAMLAARSLGIVGTAAAAYDWFHVRHVHEPSPLLIDRYAGVIAAFVQTEQVIRTLEPDWRPPPDSVAPLCSPRRRDLRQPRSPGSGERRSP